MPTTNPDHQLDPSEVLTAMEPGMAWAAAECVGWPVDCCSDTAKAVYDDWWSNGASSGLQGLGRKYLWTMVVGWFIVELEQEDVVRHVWLLEKRTQTIVDPTAGQFLAGPTAQIFTTDSPQAKLYLTDKQYKHWRRSGHLPTT
jgi:hypothetical protein